MNELGVGRREGEHPQRKSHTIIASRTCSLCIHYRSLVIFRKSTTLALFFSSFDCIFLFDVYKGARCYDDQSARARRKQ